jgi:opacity protein-like surface antigen
MTKIYLSLFFLFSLFTFNAYCDYGQAYDINTTTGKTLSKVYITKITDKQINYLEKESRVASNISIKEVEDIVPDISTCFTAGFLIGQIYPLSIDIRGKSLGDSFQTIMGAESLVILGSGLVCVLANESFRDLQTLTPDERKQKLNKITLYAPETSDPAKTSLTVSPITTQTPDEPLSQTSGPGYPIQLTSGKEYRYIGLYAVSKDQIKIIEPNGDSQIIKVNEINRIVTPKNHMAFMINGALWGGALFAGSYAIGISGTNALLQTSGVNAKLGFDAGQMLSVGVVGGLIGAGVGGAVSLIAPDDENNFKSMLPSEKANLINRIQTPPKEKIKPKFSKSHWNMIPAYSANKTLTANGFGNNEYTWQSSGTIGIGIEYENYINENLSYGIGFSFDSHPVDSEVVKTNGVQTGQTTFTGQKPELGNFNIWTNLYYYPVPKFYVLGGLSSGGDNFIPGKGPNGRKIETTKSWAYQIGLGYDLTDRFKVESTYQWASGFRMDDSTLGQSGYGSTNDLRLQLKYAL